MTSAVVDKNFDNAKCCNHSVKNWNVWLEARLTASQKLFSLKKRFYEKIRPDFFTILGHPTTTHKTDDG